MLLASPALTARERKTADRAAELFRCSQDDLARGFAAFQSPLRFRRFRQWKHFINVQTEPALANTIEHIVCAAQQLFARAYEMAEHPARDRDRAPHQRDWLDRIR